MGETWSYSLAVQVLQTSYGLECRLDTSRISQGAAMTSADLLRQLDGVRARGSGRWSARCPAHSDKSPSLSIREEGSRILLHCFAGCEPEAIVTALGLELKDLFMDSPSSQGKQLPPKPQKLDLAAVAFRFELAALDRRLRAERVLTAVGTFNGDGMNDEERDLLMKVVARAHEDQDRAEFLEAVADNFRVKAFRKGEECHAA